MNNRIHPTAIVDKKAELSGSVEVGPYSIIGSSVKIGQGCRISSHVRIVGNTSIGKNNRFFHSSTIGEEAQDLRNYSEKSRIQIGDNNVFREAVTVHRPGKDEGVTIIGNQCYFMAYSHIAHDCRVDDLVVIANCTSLGGFVEVGKGSFLSASIGVHQNCRIGDFTMVGGISGVTQDIPHFFMASGKIAKAHGINVVGLKRMGITPASRTYIKRCFKTLYLEQRSIKNAVSYIKTEIMKEIEETSEPFRLVTQFIKFIESSKRGIVSYAGSTE